MKNKKIVICLLIFLILTIVFVPIVNATNATSATINPDNYKPEDLKAIDYVDAFSVAGTILNAITITGVVISITMLMVLGIKYMMGSVEEKAEYKKTMLPMFIGAILLFSSSFIVSAIYKIMESF